MSICQISRSVKGPLGRSVSRSFATSPTRPKETSHPSVFCRCFFVARFLPFAIRRHAQTATAVERRHTRLVHAIHNTNTMTTSITDKESPRGVGDGASVLGFTSSLLSTLKSSQHKFDDWVQTQRERADAAAAAHNDLVEAQRAEIEGLEAELEAIRANLGVGGGAGAGEDNDEAAEAKGDANDGSIARQREQMKQRQAEIERSIADLHLRQGEKQRELEEMKKDEAVQRARAEEARKSKQKAEALKDQNVEDLTVGMILYKRLGLTFEKGDNGSLRFVFTQIDRNDPERPFTFKLCVNDEAMYEIKECSPPLSAGLILRLVDELNESHDGSTDGFARFVMGMRNAFKETL